MRPAKVFAMGLCGHAEELYSLIHFVCNQISGFFVSGYIRHRLDVTGD